MLTNASGHCLEPLNPARCLLQDTCWRYNAMFNSAKTSNASADWLSGAMFRGFLHLGRVFCIRKGADLHSGSKQNCVDLVLDRNLYCFIAKRLSCGNTQTQQSRATQAL